MDLTTILLLISISFSAILAVTGKYFFSIKVHYIFKPLTTALVILMSVNLNTDQSFYGYLITTGLCFSLLGDIFLMLPSDRFMHGLSSFFLAHLIFIWAFMQQRIEFSWGFSMVMILIPIITILFTYQKLGKMLLPVTLYMFVLTFMSWSAWSVYFRESESQLFIAATGTVSFLISDSVLAWDRFIKKFKAAELILLTTYFIAISLLALSI
ncbi:MAG: lysoplasmalogenase [Bacteroidales bacterium]|nr:lysoplasmalogenase [Bacteroidales bacterium]